MRRFNYWNILNSRKKINNLWVFAVKFTCKIVSCSSCWRCAEAAFATFGSMWPDMFFFSTKLAGPNHFYFNCFDCAINATTKWIHIKNPPHAHSHSKHMSQLWQIVVIRWSLRVLLFPFWGAAGTIFTSLLHFITQFRVPRHAMLARVQSVVDKKVANKIIIMFNGLWKY